MTGRQEYDRTKDRQRILDEYMIDVVYALERLKTFDIDTFYNFKFIVFLRSIA